MRIEHHAVSDAAHKMARDFETVSVRVVDVDADGVSTSTPSMKR